MAKGDAAGFKGRVTDGVVFDLHARGERGESERSESEQGGSVEARGAKSSFCSNGARRVCVLSADLHLVRDRLRDNFQRHHSQLKQRQRGHPLHSEPLKRSARGRAMRRTEEVVDHGLDRRAQARAKN